LTEATNTTKRIGIERIVIEKDEGIPLLHTGYTCHSIRELDSFIANVQETLDVGNVRGIYYVIYFEDGRQFKGTFGLEKNAEKFDFKRYITHYLFNMKTQLRTTDELEEDVDNLVKNYDLGIQKLPDIDFQNITHEYKENEVFLEAIERFEKSEHDLKERVKELNCLYGISKIADDAESVEQLLEEVVMLIPPAMQFPELTTSQIKYSGKVYKTAIFKETPYKLNTSIDIAGKRLEIDIFYLQDLPFLEFETFLIRDIGTRLKVTIETKEEMKKQVLDARMKAIMENYEHLEKIVKDRGTLSDIDPVDKQIISLLSQDGRMKLVDIGEKLSVEDKQGYSHVGVKNRITKLLEADAIRIQATMNLQKYKVVIGIMLLETGSAVDTCRVVELYKNCPRVLFCFESVGKYNLIYGILAEGIDELQAFINTCSPKTEPGVKDSQILISTRIVEPEFFPTRYFKPGDPVCEKHKDGSCRSCPRGGVSFKPHDNGGKIHSLDDD